MVGKRENKHCWATVQPKNKTVLEETVEGECKICKERIKDLEGMAVHKLKKHGSGEGGSVLKWKEKKPEEKAEGSGAGEKKTEEKKREKKKKNKTEKKKNKTEKKKNKEKTEDKPKGKKKARKGKKKT